jgi:hypothetical protein
MRTARDQPFPMTTEKRTCPEIHYASGRYWLRCAAGRYIELDKQDIHLHLIKAGFSADDYVGPLTELQAIIYKTQMERWVDYAGPLAGHRCGAFVTPSGGRILVTSEPRHNVFEVPAVGKLEIPQHWEKFLCELFTPDPEQIHFVLAWLKCAQESLRRQDWRPGQVLVLAGPSQCGKSLFQHLVTALLGGRGADPYRYMMGRTPFNSDLAKAEHLLIEDKAASTDIRTRRNFGMMIKDFAFCSEMSVHPKGHEAFNVPVFHRLTISTNDEPENLMIVPPMDTSLLDKITLLKCGLAKLSADRKENWDNLTKEIPKLARFLQQFRIPASMHDPRCGVRAYQNAELLDLICELSPELRMANLIDEVIKFKSGPWIGTAEKLEQELYLSPFRFAVEKLLHFSTACGVYLARLAAKNPQRFECRKKGANRTEWIIRAPSTKLNDAFPEVRNSELKPRGRAC